MPSADNRLPATCRGMPLHESLAGASNMGPALARWPSSLFSGNQHIHVCTHRMVLTAILWPIDPVQETKGSVPRVFHGDDT